MASEKEASAEDGFAGSRVILPSGCDVRRDAEWPMVGMETRLSEHLPRLPAGSFRRERLTSGTNTCAHAHTYTWAGACTFSRRSGPLCQKA